MILEVFSDLGDSFSTDSPQCSSDGAGWCGLGRDCGMPPCRGLLPHPTCPSWEHVAPRHARDAVWLQAGAAGDGRWLRHGAGSGRVPVRAPSFPRRPGDGGQHDGRPVPAHAEGPAHRASLHRGPAPGLQGSAGGRHEALHLLEADPPPLTHSPWAAAAGAPCCSAAAELSLAAASAGEGCFGKTPSRST